MIVIVYVMAEICHHFAITKNFFRNYLSKMGPWPLVGINGSKIPNDSQKSRFRKPGLLLNLQSWPNGKLVNPLPDYKILDWSKLKQIADDILKCI